MTGGETGPTELGSPRAAETASAAAAECIRRAVEMARAVAIGRELATKVNKKFSCLTIEIDAVFKRLLLLKKKKYAALKPDGEMEVKVRLSSLDENLTSRSPDIN